jgi:branched-chain amino acid transport system substrate-binding protein
MKRTRYVRIAGAVVGLALLAAACGGDDSDSSSADDTSGGDATEYTIAYVGPLTGDAANLGVFIRDGAKVAVDEFNESQDEIEINLDEFDTQGDPAQAPTVAADYVNDEDVLGIVGPAFSGETKAVLPTLEDAGLVMVSASATNVQLPDTVPDGKTFHRVLADDAAQAKGLVKYLTTTLKPKTIAIVHDNSEYGQGLAVNELAAQLAGTDIDIVATEAIDPDSEDYSAAVNTVKSANPDAVFFGGYYEEAGTLAKQLKDEGVTATFISADGALDQGFIDAAGDAAEGAQISCPCNLATKTSPGGLGEFAASYEDRIGNAPGTYSTEAYDATNILIAGIVAGNTDRASLLSYVEGLTAVPEAISKDVTFAPNGNIEAQGIFLFEVKDGAFAPLIATDDIPES